MQLHITLSLVVVITSKYSICKMDILSFDFRNTAIRPKNSATDSRVPVGCDGDKASFESQLYLLGSKTRILKRDRHTAHFASSCLVIEKLD